MFDRFLVAKSYTERRHEPNADEENNLANPIACILLTKTTVRSGKWVKWDLIRSNPGSMLFVSRYGADLAMQELLQWHDLIRDAVPPFMATENPAGANAVQRLRTAIQKLAFARGIATPKPIL
ncbi:hypothetical protein PCL_01122 [Purpureocillium lilacinum]|uniref:Uncharacterized protein n=1 Tax=Purpureocillium lilacinum TaxID=33203 RepID=A0A179FUI4_PURLI|nr:hypothetical protein VFPBJ_10657 [Purpureocillium lilacinum]PWI69475.1 hypothetical protein PCL_01122 [Purpureocillium lilacinum]